MHIPSSPFLFTCFRPYKRGKPVLIAVKLGDLLNHFKTCPRVIKILKPLQFDKEEPQILMIVQEIKIKINLWQLLEYGNRHSTYDCLAMNHLQSNCIYRFLSQQQNTLIPNP